VNPLRPALRHIPPYTLRGETARVRLNRNESPFDWPHEWKQAVLKRALERPWSRYPEFVPVSLVRALARRWKWPEDGIAVGNGSNELLQALIMATLEPGRSVLMVEPTFVLYALQAGVAGAQILTESLDEEWRYEVDRLEARLRSSKPTVLFLCSPNNPTGSWIEPERLAELARSAPKTLIVLDEAYGEFARCSAAALRPMPSNLAVLKTFSKAAGLAGLRIGYLLAAPEIARAVGQVKLPYSVDFFAMMAAEHAIEGQDLLEERVQILVRERERLRGEMEHIEDVKVYPSQANFLLFEVDDAQRVFQGLVQRDILVRDISSAQPRLGRSLRVTVGRPEENNLFLAALRQVMEER
jgi:histidinol-phosphate aminotransferase